MILNLIIILSLSILEIVVFKVLLNIINKYDETILNKNKKIDVAIFIVTSIFYFKFGLSINFFFLNLLAYYLIISSFIDYKTMNVYSFLNYFMLLIAFIFFIINHLFNGYNLTFETIIITLIFIIINILFSKIGAYGDGDTEVYIVLSCFFAIVCKNNLLEMLLVDMLLANILIILLNIKEFDLKKLKFKRKVAFIPAIALATIILCLV
ncbi:prepilin peptidase [Clostridium baratii]|uniref:Prepilin peptidase n=1 Tax=Clostridium baratii TaxID=1561 RepID=A0A174VGC1_9CLOT|nr:prepilin peptidase [Clostridium baratii]CUQ30129.1 prepilin peptidase [Clostridium baratii]